MDLLIYCSCFLQLLEFPPYFSPPRNHRWWENNDRKSSGPFLLRFSFFLLSRLVVFQPYGAARPCHLTPYGTVSAYGPEASWRNEGNDGASLFHILGGNIPAVRDMNSNT